jgi:hypothetical protein
LSVNANREYAQSKYGYLFRVLGHRFMGSEGADALASKKPSSPFISLKPVTPVSPCVGRVKVME